MEKRSYQRVHDKIVNRLIAEHENTWGYAWPFDRALVATHYLEAKTFLSLPQNSKARPKEVFAEALVAMRTDHHFPDHEAPFGTK